MSNYNEQLNNINNKLSNMLSSIDEIQIVELTQQGQPDITVESNGLVTATVLQTEGYVEGGTATTTHQISVEDEPNLIPENIKKGVCIFGIEGNQEGGGIEEGRQEAYDTFWDTYQDNGDRVDYSNAFAGRGWRPELIKPKYPMYPTNAYMMFRGNAHYFDFKKHLNDNGIILDFKNCTTIQYAFSTCYFTDIGVLDFTSASSLGDCFLSASYLTNIDKIILKDDGSQSLGTKPFSGCSNLTEVRFEGVIGTTGMTFSANTKLSHDSIMSIIDALQDLTGTGTTKSVTFGTTHLAKLTDAEKAIATDKGWTLA